MGRLRRILQLERVPWYRDRQTHSQTAIIRQLNLRLPTLEKKGNNNNNSHIIAITIIIIVIAVI
eukprot:scaffold256160_cov16-Prasinocladus_malaysianus.AAC.2